MQATIPAPVASDLKPHPSRSAKLCNDCAYFSENIANHKWQSLCEHPSAPVSLVTGKACLAKDMRLAPRMAHSCGLNGIWFAPLPSPGCSRCRGRGWITTYPFKRALGESGQVTTSCPDCKAWPIATATDATASAETGPENSA